MLVVGMVRSPQHADTRPMLWPVAALAVFLLGFVVVYGSVLQARTEGGMATRRHEDPVTDIDAA